MDSGIECIIDKFAGDANLNGVADMPKRLDVIQREQAGEAGPCEPQEVQKGQMQGPAPGAGQVLLSVQDGG